MAEPSSTSFLVGAGMSSAATYLLGPILGNYAVILGMGLMGTLVALTDEDFHLEGQVASWGHRLWLASKFLFRGMALSLAFAGLGAYFIAKGVPAEYELTPYAILSSVAFTIGWTSNKWGAVKERIVSIVGDIFERFASGKK